RQLLLVDGFLAELRAEVLQQHFLVEQLHLDEEVAEAVARLALAGEGLGELRFGQDAVVDQHLAERHPAPALAGWRHPAVGGQAMAVGATSVMQSSIAKSAAGRQLPTAQI